MAVRGARRRLLVPTATTAFFMALLLGLGIWQLYRLRWKEGILAEIAAAVVAAPVPLAGAPPRFSRVVVHGRYAPGFTALYGVTTRDGPRGPVLGGDALALLLRDGAPPLLVDRGWVPAPAMGGAAPPPPAGEVAVVGYVHEAESAGLFTPRDDAKAKRVFALDPPVIATEFHLPAPADFVLVAMAADGGAGGPGAGGPIPAAEMPRPPNNHFQYAMTWFALAVALGVIYGIHVRRVLRA
jgi:surfeit locus 1 family protein